MAPIGPGGTKPDAVPLGGADVEVGEPLYATPGEDERGDGPSETAETCSAEGDWCLGVTLGRGDALVRGKEPAGGPC